MKSTQEKQRTMWSNAEETSDYTSSLYDVSGENLEKEDFYTEESTEAMQTDNNDSIEDDEMTDDFEDEIDYCNYRLKSARKIIVSLLVILALALSIAYKEHRIGELKMQKAYAEAQLIYEYEERLEIIFKWNSDQLNYLLPEREAWIEKPNQSTAEAYLGALEPFLGYVEKLFPEFFPNAKGITVENL